MWQVIAWSILLFAIKDPSHALLNDEQQDWWEATIIYQIYPRSFKDSNGDGIGDLNGITTSLYYLKDIGVGATWLSPIFKSPMYDFGYDVSDYYEIQEEYGTMEDFERLILKAKELDIKIILDFVPNHTSNESEWFQKSLQGDAVYRDWFIWEDPLIDETGHRKPPNNWVSVFRKSAWEYKAERNQYYLHQFLIGQPDLNFRNPIVVNEMKNVIKFWLEKGVSGFRIDAVNHLFEVDKEQYGRYPDEPLTGYLGQGPDDYGYLYHIYTKDQEEVYDMVYQWREVFDAIKTRDGVTRVMMTEAYTDMKNTMRYYGDGQKEGAHIPFNFGLIEDLDKHLDARDLKHIIDRWITYKPMDKQANWVLGNHDKSRVASRFRPQLVDALNMLILLLPGVAVTYMGEEIGMIDGFVSWKDTKDPQALNTEDPINYLAYSRDPERTPFQWNSGKNAGFSTSAKTWLPVAAGYKLLNMEKQRAAPKSHLHIYRILADLRKKKTFRFGTYHSLALGTDVFAFERIYKNIAYLVVMNIGNTTQEVDLSVFPVSNQLQVVLSSILSTRTNGDHVNPHSTELAANEALVLLV